MTGIFGGETVLSTSWLNGRSGGVPADLTPGTEVTICALDTGAAYCLARIVGEIDTPDGPGHSMEYIEAR